MSGTPYRSPAEKLQIAEPSSPKHALVFRCIAGVVALLSVGWAIAETLLFYAMKHYYPTATNTALIAELVILGFVFTYSSAVAVRASLKPWRKKSK